MALIGKIRKNLWLVVVLLALALGGFILMDMTSGGNQLGRSSYIGKIDGEKVDFFDFQRAEQAFTSNTGDIYNTRKGLWDFFVEKVVIDKISEKTGIMVGPDEQNELEFGTNLSPIMQSFFRDPRTGQVDRQQLNEVKSYIDEGKAVNPEFKARFTELRKQVTKTQKQNKLVNLITKSVYTPSWLANVTAKYYNESANIDYVRVPYDKVEDSSVSVTDEDVLAFIAENPTKYIQKEEVRAISYITFDVTPTAADSAKILERLNALKAELINTPNDSSFIESNGGAITPTFMKADDMSGIVKDTIKKMSVGQIVGPFAEMGTYQVLKLMDKKIYADSAKASHILRRVENNDPVQLANASKYIDSLKTLIAAGSISFKDAATQNSQDEGSAVSGGDLGTFAPGMMVQEFNDAVFNGKAGGTYTVTTQFGVHLINVEKLIYASNEYRYKFGILFEQIVPSEETQSASSDKILGYLESAKTLEDLDKIAAANNAKVEVAGGIKRNDFNIGDLAPNQNTRDIIKWAYDKQTKIGEVSSQLYTYRDEQRFVDSKHVIVGLKSIDKAGKPSIDAVRQTAYSEILNTVKAKKIIAAVNGKSMSAISEMYGVTLNEDQNITFGGANFTDGGYEPSLTGKIFGAKEGSTIGPVYGKNGVFMVKVKSLTKAVEDPNSSMMKMQMSMLSRSQAGVRFIEALKSNVKIKDNRNSFF